MIPRDRRLIWGAAWGVDVLFLLLAALSSNLFLFAGGLILGVLLAVFTYADSRTAGED